MKFQFSPFVAVEVNNYEGACEFYENVLGMKALKRHPVESHFQAEGISGEMNFFVSQVKNENPGSGTKDIFFEFRVESASEAKALLEEKGCKILNVYSEKSFLTEDPFGLRYHIFQE